MTSRDEVAIVGYAARLPGASTADSFWRLLLGNRCSVDWITPDRFPTSAFYHPSTGQPGRSYTFAAGVIDDVWGFDAQAFGMSPREAEQVDPQQRHLLEVTYDALAHAGIRPSSLAGTHTGVYVGASSVDYGARFFADPSAADVHMMTGNTLSVISNRLSYNMDLRGPSFTVDTACSSSLVALNQAAEAIRSGAVDTAIVGGVNLLLSPFSFVGFSRASMLSPTGRCRPFDAAADGYVRAEGAIVLVLRSMSAARKARNAIHATIVGSGVGQDGRTTGMSLPSATSQRDLLERVYRDFSVDPNDLVYVEAHGTGTKVGDPMEADALGKGLAQLRSQALPIGSVKSNIGHLEPASGLAGVLKSLLVFEHGIVPATLHQQTPSPDIPFDDLNLAVVSRNARLPDRRGAALIGVNSFGFGGTNAHVVLSRQDQLVSMVHVRHEGAPPPLLLSAHSQDALRALAGQYEKNWPDNDRVAADFIRATAHNRDHLTWRMVARGGTNGEVVHALKEYASGKGVPSIIDSHALGNDLPVAFLFSGNGSQWAGMGRNVIRSNARFRAAIEEIDTQFAKRQDWSIQGLLFADDLGAKLRQATYAQPLLLALQVATVRVLEENGVTPVATLGHSVGEIAAAWAAGMLSLDQAIDVVIARSRHQEVTCRTGGMAALMLSEKETRRLLRSLEIDNVDVAAINSWRSVTISGPAAQIDRVVAAADQQKIGARKLDLDYPFHSALVDPVRGPLLRELQGLTSLQARKKFASSVTGRLESGPLDAEHWWENVRRPVRFEAGLDSLLKDGIRLFVEVGPRPILSSYVRDGLRDADTRGAIIETLTAHDNEDAADALERTTSKVFLSGGHIDLDRFVGRPPIIAMPLPRYPWQHTHFEVQPTDEATATFQHPRHALLGSRARSDSTDWYSTVDPAVFPWISDHKVAGIPVFPATAYVESMLAAARELHPDAAVELRDLDIVKPLAFDADHSYETRVRVAPETGLVEFQSRQRIPAAAWQINARGIIGRSPVDSELPAPMPVDGGNVFVPQARIYEISSDLGFGYGPQFRRVVHARFPDANTGVAPLENITELAVANAVTDFTAFDSAFHILFASEEAGVADQPMRRMLPVRFGQVRCFIPGAIARRAISRTIRRSATSIVANLELLDESDRVVLTARNVRLIDAPVAPGVDARALAYSLKEWSLDREGEPSTFEFPSHGLGFPGKGAAAAAEAGLLLEAASIRAIWDAFDSRRGEIEKQDEYFGSSLLWHLVVAGHASEDAGKRSIANKCDLPELDEVVRSLIVRHPDMATEAAVLSRLSELLPALLAGNEEASNEVTGSHWAQLGASMAPIARLREAVAAELGTILSRTPEDRLVRLLVLGANQADIIRDLLRIAGNLEVLIADPDSDRLDYARANLADEAQRTRFVNWKELAELPRGTIDIVCAIDALSEIAAGKEGLRTVRGLMRPNGCLVAGELAPGVFWDLVRGLQKGWWDRSIGPDFPVGALLNAREWEDELRDGGFTSIRITGEERMGSLIRCRAAQSEQRSVPPLPDAFGVSWLVPTGARFAALRELLPAAAANVPATDVIWTFDLATVQADSSAAQSRFLTHTLTAIADQIRETAAAPARLWFVLDFGDGDMSSSPLARPLWCALTSALRTARNEYAGLDIRCIGLSGAVDPRTLAQEFQSPDKEVELFMRGRQRLVFRVDKGLDEEKTLRAEEGELLRISTRSLSGRGLQGWTAEARTAPGAGQVEIEVAATGLNFRDVMWNLGLLPEEALEDGFAGPTLGMECAGIVASVGPGVTDLSVGEKVVAFAANSFASHVIVPSYTVSRLPEQVSCEDAATIPVAFLTSYYSLVHLAQLQKGERVLIHGGAGAVGLSALQIAKLRGAEVVMTAGSPEKRALLRSLGADLVLNSRNLRFADDIMAHTKGAGVDVVLNSLAGEAMMRSLACLKPQGRFVELGKRDFYTNTHLGLRPFRRNLSYFGVDIDQLIGEQRDLMKRLFEEIVDLFAAGTFTPLPHRLFAGEAIADAFRHMQRSGHIGKVILKPAKFRTARRPLANRFPVSADGLHVVIGGTRGFGLATAEWLASHGARHLALLSRSGTVAQPEAAQLEALRAKGIEVETAAVDVTDETALKRFVEQAHARRKVAGIVHAAMVLEDRLIENMDLASIEAGLAPKVAGALNLEAIAGKLGLEYLLLYSSATTLLGNPGQFNYVAANGYLEGMARRAQQAGLPVATVAWGAIQDVGFLARNLASSSALRRKFASSLLRSRDALDALGQVWGQGKGSLALARIDWPAARRDLAMVRTPAFDWIVAPGAARQGGDSVAILEKLKAMTPDQAVEAITDMVVEEIARVLRLPAKEVDRHRPLAEVGMDSLMMLELRMTVEETLQVDLPLMSLANGTSAADVARKIAPLLLGEERQQAIPGTLTAMAGSHFAGDAQATSAEDRQAAADNIVRRVRSIEGPL